jgi:pimeloyl-ACP methyl ester carboxylesterase
MSSRPPSETRTYKITTSVGEVWLYGRPELRETHAPTVVIFHGAFGRPADFADWFARLEPGVQVVLASLPRHAGAPALKVPGVAGYVAAFAAALDTLMPGRQVLCVGVSLGGLVALGLAGRGRPALAFDPFLTTAKLWPIEATLRRAMARGDPIDADFVAEVFGFRGDQVVDQDYRGWLGALAAPVVVAAGSVPLLPPRDLQDAPSLLDDDDRVLLLAHPRVRLVTFEGHGHVLVEASPDRCRDLILDTLAALPA